MSTDDRSSGGGRPDAPFALTTSPVRPSDSRIVPEPSSSPALSDSASTAESPTGPALDIPRQLGPYNVLGVLGEGGMGKVYLARDDKLDRDVAIKVLATALAGSAPIRDRFLLEARAIAKVNHPNVVQVYYADQDQGVCFFAMERVRGITLDDLIRRMGRLEVGAALAIVRQAAQGLEAAFVRGILHRDIKPSNIIVEASGRVMLLDFGLAKDMGASTSRTSTGIILGTPRYMSPEQGRGLAPDFRSDIYALGVTLYEALAGEPLFDADTPLAVIDKHVRQPVPDIRTRRDNVPPGVVALLARMLAKEPGERYSSYASLLNDLAAAASGAGPAGARAATPRVPTIPLDAPVGAMEGKPSPVAATASTRHEESGSARRKSAPLDDTAVPLAATTKPTPPPSAARTQTSAPAGAPTPAALPADAGMGTGAPLPLSDLGGALLAPRPYFEGPGQTRGALRSLGGALAISFLTAALISHGHPFRQEPLQLLVTALVLAAVTHGLARLVGGQGTWRQTLALEVAAVPGLALALVAILLTHRLGQAAAAAAAAAAIFLHLRARRTGLRSLHRLTEARSLLCLAPGVLIALAYIGQTVHRFESRREQANAQPPVSSSVGSLPPGQHSLANPFADAGPSPDARTSPDATSSPKTGGSAGERPSPDTALLPSSSPLPSASPLPDAGRPPDAGPIPSGGPLQNAGPQSSGPPPNATPPPMGGPPPFAGPPPNPGPPIPGPPPIAGPPLDLPPPEAAGPLPDGPDAGPDALIHRAQKVLDQARQTGKGVDALQSRLDGLKEESRSLVHVQRALEQDVHAMMPRLRALALKVQTAGGRWGPHEPAEVGIRHALDALKSQGTDVADLISELSLLAPDLDKMHARERELNDRAQSFLLRLRDVAHSIEQVSDGH